MNILYKCLIRLSLMLCVPKKTSVCTKKMIIVNALQLVAGCQWARSR